MSNGGAGRFKYNVDVNMTSTSSDIKLQESADGKIHIVLNKNDARWDKLNDQITHKTGGIWSNEKSRWIVPKSESAQLRTILNNITDEDQYEGGGGDDDSGDEGYMTDSSVDDAPLSLKSKKVHSLSSFKKTPSRNKLNDTKHDDIFKSHLDDSDDDDRNDIRNDDHNDDHNDDFDDDRNDIDERDDDRNDDRNDRDDDRHISRDSNKFDVDAEENAFDYTTDDARIDKIKKIMRHAPFRYYLRHSLPKNEFKYLIKLAEI